ncbi:hypothetical protein QBC46DRAFT_393854 [Diplogelasinospora grovesii]|uniref:FAD-binding PCMH-type domain-containing protein n=1 Tax=Diplogelasinospora grovesii TaxID=303347 RepID=A0AAN6N2F0_9PEZI|nr:hypothetical protein QBC46DRAFT_393854 [Diplogelasinospora grovesii]
MDDVMKVITHPAIPVFNPGEVEYERSVAVPNLLYRFSRPDVVVQPEGAAHVQTIIREAASQGVAITIKNGGHSYAGASTTDKGILMDLVRMNKIELDMDAKMVTVQGGAQWGHAYKELVNGKHDGYIINGGRCPTVGVSGFLLGGGLSPFTRSFGMGCDTVKEATIVTADGRIVTVSDSDPPTSDKGRLFWALRGAGHANFGVVVELKLRVQKLSNRDGLVTAGRFTWFPKPDQMDSFMSTMNNFYTAKWPDQVTIDSSWLCDLQNKTSEIAVRFLVYYDGNKSDFEKLVDKNIKEAELVKQLKRRTMQEKSTRFLHETLVAQWSEEIVKAFPTNRSYSIYTSFLFKNNKEDVISQITGIIRSEMKEFRDLFGGETALLQVTWIHAGGQASKKKRSETAFRWRDCTYHAYIMLQWEEKWLERDMRGFLQRFKEKLRGFSMMGRAAFINFPDASLPQDAHERAYYGNNHQELRRIKEIWDRGHFFKWPQGVSLPPGVNAMSAANARQWMAQRMGTAGVATSGSTGERQAMEAEEEKSTDAPPAAVDEEALTDAMADRQWSQRSTKAPPPKKVFVGVIRGAMSEVPVEKNDVYSGIIRGLDDLGF